jgi:hypothetical protein
VTFNVVDVSERGGSDAGPHCRHGKLVRQMKIVGEFTSGRHKCAQGTTPLSAAICWSDRNIHRISREVAPTPMPLILNQGSGPLQDLNINRLRHGNSPPISPFFAELNSSHTVHTIHLQLSRKTIAVPPVHFVEKERYKGKMHGSKGYALGT